MKFHTVFNRPPNPCSCSGGVSLTDQQYRDECNVDKILKRYASGDSSMVRQNGFFGDVSGLADFNHCLEIVRQANDSFMELPSDVRARFGNDPRALVEFLQNPSNDDEAVTLGLKVRPVVKPTLSDEIVKGVTDALSARSSSGE